MWLFDGIDQVAASTRTSRGRVASKHASSLTSCKYRAMDYSLLVET